MKICEFVTALNISIYCTVYSITCILGYAGSINTTCTISNATNGFWSSPSGSCSCTDYVKLFTTNQPNLNINTRMNKYYIEGIILNKL